MPFKRQIAHVLQCLFPILCQNNKSSKTVCGTSKHMTVYLVLSVLHKFMVSRWFGVISSDYNRPQLYRATPLFLGQNSTSLADWLHKLWETTLNPWLLSLTTGICTRDTCIHNWHFQNVVLYLLLWWWLMVWCGSEGWPSTSQCIHSRADTS